jgi:hypothetical protein
MSQQFDLETDMQTNGNLGNGRKAAYSVTDVARLCRVSRARFYDLVKAGVMPYPVYCIFTRRPLYPADLAMLCLRVRETNIALDGRYVVFYSRNLEPNEMPVVSRSPARRSASPDPLLKEMIETLRAMGVQVSDEQISVAVSERCPNGVGEETFEIDLRAVFDFLRCRNVG